MKRIKYAVLVIARNEEKTIIPTLKAITEQSLQPIRIIVVNDGSNDGTQDKIKRRFPDITVLDYPHKHESYIHDPKLARTFNYGLDELTVLDLDYLLIMGADHIIPINYSEFLINNMEKDPNLAITSGTIQGEFNTLPRGSGRMIRNSFFRLIGYHYPENYGHETWHLFKAMQLKFKVFNYNSILTTARKTGIRYNIKYNQNRGRSYRALGYSKLYMMFLFTLKLDKQSIQDIKIGYNDDNVKLYDEELRSFVSTWQKKRLLHLSSLKKLKGVHLSPRIILDKIKPRYLPKGELTTDKIKRMYLKGGARHGMYGTRPNPLRTKLREYCKTLNINSAFEFGCNVGINLKEISPLNHYGIDINQQAINKGKKLNLNVELGDEETLKTIPDNSYDLVLTSSVLDHILDKDFEDIFNNLKRITKKYLICLETNDVHYLGLFAHDYNSMVPKWSFFSSKKDGGNNANYTLYHWEKKNGLG